jgi:hypothetical protein
MSMGGRRGHSVLEVLVALTLGAMVLGAALGLLHGVTHLGRATNARTLRSETLRVVAEVLRAETRWLQPALDVRAWAADSLALRAFRAAGSVCVQNPDGTGLLGMDGLRTPDAAKDSILILRAPDQELGARLLSADPRPGPCAGHSRAYLIRASAPLQSGDPILIFESGMYYLSQRALRYRLGSEGRQPLTAEALDAQRSFFTPTSMGGTAWLAARGSHQGAQSLRVRLPFLNQQP